MIPQVTAAALVSENKQRAYPASVDSIPTSANQEDHVSMAAHGARRLLPMARERRGVVGIETARRRAGLRLPSPARRRARRSRTCAPGCAARCRTLDDDRYFHPDIAGGDGLIACGALIAAGETPLRPSTAGATAMTPTG